MWNQPGPPVALDPSQLTPGLFVWLDLRWDEHPFLTSRFLVKSAHDVDLMRALPIQGRLYHHPEKSTALPLPVQTVGTTPTPESSAAQASLVAEVQTLEAAKKTKLRAQKDAAARADRAWEQAARATRESLLTLSRSPKTAGQQLLDLSRDTAAQMARGSEVLLHLLGDKAEQGPQFHALNVMTLSMLVGKRLGLTEVDLADLALAALAHDAGKSEVPATILNNAQRKKHEEDFYRQHVLYGAEFATASGAFSPQALAMVADHHEALDGSGWPTGKTQLSLGTRILAVVDRYDRLCTPEAAEREPLMPAEALAHLFRKDAGRFDTACLSALIKLLGIYPPGTVVQLNEGSLALVVSPGPHSLQPKVLVYSPELNKAEAPTLALWSEPGLKIAEALRPSSLPADVRAWLNPQQRLSYFFSVDDRPA